jgi:hypothetical protein
LRQPGKNLIRLAESLGYRVTRAADGGVEARRMSRAELEVVIERDSESLAPGERARLKRLAAGTLNTIGSEAEAPPQ